MKLQGISRGDATVRAPRRERPSTQDHLVLVYEEEEFLLDAVGRWVSDGLEAGDGCIVVATRSHLERLAQKRAAAGQPIEAATERGQYVELDASELLARLLVDKAPDPGRFAEIIGGLVAALERRYPRVRIFGEMVALLCAADDSRGAIRLEQLWNDLGQKRPFSLLCGYPMSTFVGEEHGQTLHDVCAQHSHVIPAESVTGLEDEDERDRTIAHLQQKARSLESEIKRRRATEEKLRQRERELADFLENGLEGLHQVGPDGRILWANKAELDMLGYAREEYIGHFVAEFHVDPDVPERLRLGEALHDQAARVWCKDGSIKHVRIYANALSQDGVFVHTRCFTRDVTERVRLEHELRRHVKQLSDQAARKDEFLAALGHELRNPLSAITSGLQVLRMQDDRSSDERKVIDIVDRQTRHMARLVEDLLDVSRITRGKVALRKDVIHLATAIEGALELARPLLDERRHTLTVELPGTPVRIEADPARLKQVLANLLHNAAKFTAPGGRVDLRARVAGGEVEISIRDTGIGIEAGAIERIFDLFTQAGDSIAHGGLGIGLTLVRRIVELHGGRVVAYSDGPGTGSEFVVRIPMGACLAAVSGPASSPAGSPAGLRRSGSRRVLLADDNVDGAETLARLLRLRGHLVQAVNGGAAALEEAGRFAPEVVILDIGMPGLNGYDVARRLRSGNLPSRAILVALTGFGQAADRVRAREAGFDHHLLKPVDVDELERLLARADAG